MKKKVRLYLHAEQVVEAVAMYARMIIPHAGDFKVTLPSSSAVWVEFTMPPLEKLLDQIDPPEGAANVAL